MRYSFIVKTSIVFFVLIALARVIHLDYSTILGADHRHIYTGTQLLKQGVNPYNDSLLIAEWEEIQGEGEIGMPYNPLIYPPFTVGIYTLFSPDQWPSARNMYLILCGIAFLIMLYMLLRHARFKIGVLVLLSFKFVPYLLVLSQPTLIVLGAFAMFFSLYGDAGRSPYDKHRILAGIVLGLSWLKPTILFPVCIYLLFQKRWTEILASLWFPILGMLVYLLYLPGDLLIPSFIDFLHNVKLLQANVLSEHAFFIGEMTIFIRPLIQWLHIPYSSISWLPLTALGIGLVYYLFRFKKMTQAQSLFYLILLTWLCLYHPAYDCLFIWIVYCYHFKEIPADRRGILLCLLLGIYILPIPVINTCIYPISLTLAFIYILYDIARPRQASMQFTQQ